MNDEDVFDEPGPDSSWKAQLQWASKWDELRKYGNHPLARMTILVPLIGYLILFNEKLSSYYSLDLALGAHIRAIGHLTYQPAISILALDRPAT
jgi:hypothetical protein